MVSIGETRKAERADGPATVMAIGTANPPNCVDQSTYTLITTSESPTTSTRLSSRRNSRSFVCLFSFFHFLPTSTYGFLSSSLILLFYVSGNFCSVKCMVLPVSNSFKFIMCVRYGELISQVRYLYIFY